MLSILFQVPNFNSSPLKSYLPKRKGSSPNYHFSGAMLNFGGVSWDCSPTTLLQLFHLIMAATSPVMGTEGYFKVMGT